MAGMESSSPPPLGLAKYQEGENSALFCCFVLAYLGGSKSKACFSQTQFSVFSTMISTDHINHQINKSDMLLNEVFTSFVISFELHPNQINITQSTL